MWGHDQGGVGHRFASGDAPLRSSASRVFVIDLPSLTG